MELATSIATSKQGENEAPRQPDPAPYGYFKNGKPRRAPQKKRRSRARPKAARQAVITAPVAEPTQLDVVRAELEALAVQLDSQLEAVKAALEALK